MPKHLTQTQRYYICLRIASFDNIKNIAKALKVHKSTVYREIRRVDASKSKLDSCLRRNDKTEIRREDASKSKLDSCLRRNDKSEIRRKDASCCHIRERDINIIKLKSRRLQIELIYLNVQQ